MRNRFLMLMLLMCFGLPAWAEELRISMVYANAVDDGLPYKIFNKKRWSPDPKARFVKLHLYFDKEKLVSGVEIDTCEPLKSKLVTLFFNFNQASYQLKPGKRGKPGDDDALESSYNKSIILGKLADATNVNSITINFEKNRGFSVCGIKIFGKNRKAYKIKVPKLVAGTVTATSTSSPRYVYEAGNLFDSRYEYGWASNKKPNNVSLLFSFKSERTITRLNIWNGYQRSEAHCVANARVKTIKLSGDKGYSQNITVEDEMDSQIVVLPKPFKGKKLKMTITKSYFGKAYKNLVVSELRFGNNSGSFMLNTLSLLKKNISKNKKKFLQGAIAEVVNDSLKAKPPKGEDFGGFTFRLRADGSFYFSGDEISKDEPPVSYFAIGNYNIKRANKKSGVKLKL